MVDLALDRHLIPDLASIVLEYCQLEHVDEVIDGHRYVYTKLFGKRHGEYKGYYQTSKLWFSEHYVDDKRHGEQKGYYSTGELLYSRHYVDGKLHGECKMYLKNGKMWNSFHFVDGVKQ